MKNSQRKKPSIVSYGVVTNGRIYLNKPIDKSSKSASVIPPNMKGLRQIRNFCFFLEISEANYTSVWLFSCKFAAKLHKTHLEGQL